MRIGTLTITGRWPMELDGLFLGYTESTAKRFALVEGGIERRGRLYKTHDPRYLAECLGVLDARITARYNVPGVTGTVRF